MKSLQTHITLFTFLLALSGCASMPQELTGGGPYADLTPHQALQLDVTGQRVRWGGSLIQARPQGERTCFEVMGQVLDKRGEPRDRDHSIGRFVACTEGFYDPAIYDDGRSVTFTGRLEGTAPQTIGDQVYRFPLMEADQVYLWPERSEVIYVPYPAPYWGPYHDPYWPYVRPRVVD